MTSTNSTKKIRKKQTSRKQTSTRKQTSRKQTSTRKQTSRKTSKTKSSESNINPAVNKSPQKLNQCIKILKHPNLHVDTPLSCYSMLEFPNEPRDKRIKPGPYHTFFEKLIGKPKITTINEIINIEHIFKNSKSKSKSNNSKSQTNNSNNIKQIKENINKEIRKPKRYLMFSVYFSTSSNYYGILYDKREKEIEFFVLPGSVKEKNDKDLELKFREFLIDQLQIPIEFFYYNISNAPKPDTYHADFWASWLIYQKIKKSTDREQLVNYALEKILRASTEYTKFTQKFTNYILPFSESREFYRYRK
jgi:hypothetical protein